MLTVSGTQNIEVAVDSGEGFSVVQFSVEEGLSSLFEVVLLVRSPDEGIDPEGIVGKPAALRIAAGRAWTGVARELELIQVEETGLSTYRLVIVPSLWLLSQRRRSRMFQDRSAVEIAEEVLAEWRIVPVLRLGKAEYPRLDVRTQYDESDYAFLGRVLTEAGIAFWFTDAGDGGETRLVLGDGAHRAEAGPPVPFVDSPNPEARLPFVTRVRIVERVQPARFTLRDFDLRRPDYPLFAEAAAGEDARLEHARFEQGSFVTGGDADGAQGARRAAVEAAARQVTRTAILFDTNVLRLAPGDVLSIESHPSPLLGPGERLLVIAAQADGAPEGEWSLSITAVPASRPYRSFLEPAARPRARGVQSAIVVGPPGEEIHTDALGRVQVRFPWDREAQPSRWIRVSQIMAGPGYGTSLIPRVGHEVLVAFLGGDPDRPVVVGSLHNGAAQPPYPLPAGKGRSVWRSATTPGGGGSNEISMDDTADRELFYIHAERDLRKLVRGDEDERTGGDRTLLVDGDLTIEARGNIVVRSDADVVIKGGPNVKINEG